MADAGRILGVELFEDRAAVTRTVTLEAGRQVVRIGPMSPLVRERAVSFPGSTGAVVEEVRVERTVTTQAEADPEHVRDLEVPWRAATERLQVLRAAGRRAAERTQRAERAALAATQAAPRGLVESADPEAWVRTSCTLLEASVAARVALARAVAETERCGRELQRLDQALSAARQGRSVASAWLVISVVAAAPGPFQVRTLVPCAMWRPSHRAVLETRDRGAAADRVRFELGAICWNATGEDWTGVPLTCSTARPGELAAPPRLADDVVDVGRRDKEVVVEVRDETVQVARERGARAAREVPGVDDGGEPRTFVAQRPVDLPSDGRPVRVPLDRFEVEATVRWLALPERGGVAVLRTLQRNGGTRPLLAGPVELVRDGVSIGRAQVGLVPPGEPFALGWGSHDGLRIARRLVTKRERTAVTGRQYVTFDVEIRVAHLGDRPCRLEVRERVAVSELREVSVAAPKAEPALDRPPDADGFCAWTLEIAPGEVRTLRLSHTVDAASNVQLPF